MDERGCGLRKVSLLAGLPAILIAAVLLLGASGPAAKASAAHSKVEVVAAEAMRLHSLGIDRLDVWVCAVPSATKAAEFDDATRRRVRVTPRRAAKRLQGKLAPYFRHLSEGRYRQSFRPRGTVELNRKQGSKTCERRVKRGSRGLDGAVVITNLPIGGPTWAAADWCGEDGGSRPPHRICDGRPHTLPGNERLIWIPAGTILDVLPTGPQLGTAAHELGHALGWPHAFTGRLFHPEEQDGETVEIGIPYDDPFDLMGYERLWGTASWTSWRGGDYRLKGTQIFNRVAAGWIRPRSITVHRASAKTYRVVPVGRPGTQLVVVETARRRAFLTLEARAKRGYDRLLPEEGINIHAVDQRGSACSFPEKRPACWGESRRQLPIPNDPDSLASLIRSGESVETAGIKVENLGPATGGGFEVRVSGRRAALPPIEPEGCMLVRGFC